MYLHQPDNQLPGIALLLEPESLAERIRHWLGPGELSLVNLRYKPGISCLVSYKLHDNLETCWVHAKAFERQDWLVRRKKITNPALIDNELAFAVYRFPLDARLESLLSFVTYPEAFLSRVLSHDNSEEQYLNYEVLAYKPNRRMVARINYASGKSFVLKLHDKTTFKTALKSASSLNKLDVFSLPVRIGRSKRRRALAYEWIRGNSLDIADMSSHSRRSMLARLFEYLERLQQPVKGRKPRLPFRRTAEGIAEIAAYVGEICTPLATLSAQIAETINNYDSQNYMPRLVHGDFHEHQIIVQPDRIVACDFDNACISDSTVDLANFCAHLNYRAILNELPDTAVAEVDEKCFDHISRGNEPQGIQRYLWNRAGCLMKLATHPFRSGSENWIANTELLLQRVEEQTQLAKNAGRTSASCRAFKSNNGSSGLDDSLKKSIQDDDRLQFLDGVFDPVSATRILGHDLPALQDKFGDYSVDRVIPLRHKPGRRCLIEFVLATADGLKSILGKSDAKRLKQKAMKIQRRLFEKHGFGIHAGDGIFVPQTIGKNGHWQMWFQEKISAESAARLMTGNRLIEISTQIAQAIVKLHLSSYLPGRVHGISDELETLNDRLIKVSRSLPAEEERIHRIHKNCYLIADEISRIPPAPVHRDFYQDQILVSEDRAWLVDLDLVALGHPALDIGNFAAHLAEHGLRNHDDADYWREEEENIIDKYLQSNSQCSRSDIDRFKAISLARHIYISWTMPERQSSTMKILDHTEQLAAEFVSHKFVLHR